MSGGRKQGPRGAQSRDYRLSLAHTEIHGSGCRSWVAGLILAGTGPYRCRSRGLASLWAVTRLFGKTVYRLQPEATPGTSGAEVARDIYRTFEAKPKRTGEWG
jgi:hypothetical protein